MSNPSKQHLIDPEICIRCYTCEASCPIEAITHDDNNVVVDHDKCNLCMDCIPVCPTGSIDNWRVVSMPYSVEDQLSWEELPDQEDFPDTQADTTLEALDDSISALLAEAHAGAGGVARAPSSASKPNINLYTLSKPAEATVTGNYRLTDEQSDSDVRHIILDMGSLTFPLLEGQSVGITPPGADDKGRPYLPRLYSVSSPRDGERPNFNNLSLTVKRDENGICSNYICDLAKGARVQITGPFGSTFLLPNDVKAKLLMICTGTGSAPFRAFTMQRLRTGAVTSGAMVLVFGARSPSELPYFGPLNKVPDDVLEKHLAFSRIEGQDKHYVQDELLKNSESIARLIVDPDCHLYICGLKAMEEGVAKALADIAEGAGKNWTSLRDAMLEDGRYHVETY